MVCMGTIVSGLHGDYQSVVCMGTSQWSAWGLVSGLRGD